MIKLTQEHQEQVRAMFNTQRYMGSNLSDSVVSVTESGALPADQARDPRVQNEILYNRFADTYLSGLNSFHAQGLFSDSGELETFIAYFQASDEPAWYYTLCHSRGNITAHRRLLDQVIGINEGQGRLKFYTLINARYRQVVRRFGWSKYNSQRYGYFDEYLVPEKNRCFYSQAWELLYKRALLPEPTIVRCSFLRQEYRSDLPHGGSI